MKRHNEKPNDASKDFVLAFHGKMSPSSIVAQLTIDNINFSYIGCGKSLFVYEAESDKRKTSPCHTMGTLD